MEEYMPCEPCSQKVGAYTLCESCLHNRNTISTLSRDRDNYMVEASRLKSTVKSILDYIAGKA